MSVTQAASKFVFCCCCCFSGRHCLAIMGGLSQSSATCLGGRGDTIGEGNVFYWKAVNCLQQVANKVSKTFFFFRFQLNASFWKVNRVGQVKRWHTPPNERGDYLYKAGRMWDANHANEPPSLMSSKWNKNLESTINSLLLQLQRYLYNFTVVISYYLPF